MLPDDRSTRRSFLATGSTATLLTLCGGCSLFLDIRAPDVKAKAVDGKVRIPLEEHPAITETGGTLALEVEGMSDKIRRMGWPRNAAILSAPLSMSSASSVIRSSLGWSRDMRCPLGFKKNHCLI